ncbi:hypothetical protein [Pseudonocardia sp. NPDC046786]|uniref:hypothetical protein n=1 Tax=Pseudonocardia sp. NPDC046786 TaxID=3155471 RepID=UPI0033FC4922
MIALQITVGCDDCAVALAGTDQARTTTDGLAAARAAGWVVRLSGRLLCPACADPALCRLLGHDFGPAPVWRACACDGSLWSTRPASRGRTRPRGRAAGGSGGRAGDATTSTTGT